MTTLCSSCFTLLPGCCSWTPTVLSSALQLYLESISQSFQPQSTLKPLFPFQMGSISKQSFCPHYSDISSYFSSQKLPLPCSSSTEPCSSGGNLKPHSKVALGTKEQTYLDLEVSQILKGLCYTEIKWKTILSVPYPDSQTPAVVGKL